jgi:hypothetical protein
MHRFAKVRLHPIHLEKYSLIKLLRRRQRIIRAVRCIVVPLLAQDRASGRRTTYTMWRFYAILFQQANQRRSTTGLRNNGQPYGLHAPQWMRRDAWFLRKPRSFRGYSPGRIHFQGQ